MNNVDPVIITRKPGHSRVSTTQDIYCHLLEQADDMARDASGSRAVWKREEAGTAAGEVVCVVFVNV